MKKAM